jgi:hypothetical protein
MKTVINLEEKFGKIVGRRVVGDSFRYGMGLQKTGAQLAQTFGQARMPKGAFKFHSHEEADAWLMKYRTRKTPI